MRNHIQSLINGSDGHVAVFCPSYKLMSEIIGDTFFKGVTKIVESRDWSKDDIDKVVGKLKKARSDDKRIMLCGVFGARLSEGIDYDDGIGIDEVRDESIQLIRMIDVLGREYKEHQPGILLFYIYDNGSVERKIILE